jgi:hypothetical protein
MPELLALYNRFCLCLDLYSFCHHLSMDFFFDGFDFRKKNYYAMKNSIDIKDYASEPKSYK